MKRTIVHLYIGIVLAGVTSGCRKESSNRPLSLNEKEYYSDSQLSSISADGDSAFFIGNEKGDIYRYDKHTGRFYDTLRTETDRIYNVAVKKSENDTFYLISVRNSGLMMYRYDNKRLISIKKFLIQDSIENYSPYKTIVCDNQIYVATSHGLFYKNLSQDSDNRLEQLYPTQENGKMSPFLTTSLIKYGNYIYAASESGLIKCDVTTNRINVLHRGEEIKSAQFVNGNIHSLSKKSLYIDSNDGSKHDEYEINTNADIYYYAGNTHYFIYSDKVVVARDCDLGKTDGYKTIPLRRNVRPDCRNVIMADSITGHSLLITENALFRIPFHLDVFNTDGKTTAACSENDCIYFVTNNSLFRMRNNDSKAKRIADLPQTDRITTIMFHNNTLYYLNGFSELKCKHINNSFIVNHLSGNPETIYSTSRGITTAGIGCDGCIYIGIRDSLLLLHGKKIEVVKTPIHPFVNKIVINEKDNNTYAALLNGGILRLYDNKSSVVDNSTNHSFIKDIAFASFSNQPCILTNHFLFSPNGKDSVASEGFSRLLTPDGKTFYALMENGIRKYIIDHNGIRQLGDTLCDIRFSPSISLVHGNNIYIGATSLGIIKLKPDGISQWVRFNHDVYTPDYKTIIFIFVLVCLSAGFVLWYRRRKRQDFGIFSEWEKVRKDIAKINPGQAKAMERMHPQDTESMEKLRDKGLLWIERYNKLIKNTVPLKELLSFTIFPMIDKSSDLYNTIYRLESLLNGNDFDLNECETLYIKAQTTLHNINTDDLKQEIWDLYNEGHELIERINTDFEKRLKKCMKNIHKGFADTMAGTVEILKSLNRKIVFMSMAKEMSTILIMTEELHHLFFDTNDNDATANIKRAEINERLRNMYATLSADSILMETIGYKPMNHNRKDTPLTDREKALMLMMIKPVTDWEMIKSIYNIKNKSNTNIKIINNLRATFSKVKKNIIDKRVNIKTLMSLDSDSTSLFFDDMLKEYVKKE
ncbi:MAG: hypothetical protein J6B92_08405 [Paraprevotella sp.]|nr:hypothetical protein [Paraprevotella sp.]